MNSIVLDVAAGMMLANGVRATTAHLFGSAFDIPHLTDWPPFVAGVIVALVGTAFVAWRIFGLP